MRLRRLVVLTALMILVSTQARAGERSWWAWLEELSGPGYFTGWMVSFDYCPGDPGCKNLRGAWLSAERPTRFPKVVSFTFGRLTSAHRERFKDVPTSSSKDDPNR